MSFRAPPGRKGEHLGVLKADIAVVGQQVCPYPLQTFTRGGTDLYFTHMIKGTGRLSGHFINPE